jgi:hypothetical protein
MDLHFLGRISPESAIKDLKNDAYQMPWLVVRVIIFGLRREW